ncbi:AAA family ATPase [Calorimonas adulescens]|uniref:MinD/ParA family protein n=1 Tax=Calorimonas adulescens TaxID=2606906 RepID=A0A5D8QFG6_9THEO|nr:AAA family ATPase [Calorimonas adulescens]TZE83335.1 MinD/ParA family protein [Calorimonas adulescens]
MDQAESLRRIVQGNNGIKKAKIVTVTSGKGGVGKTSFSVNLGICMSQAGYRVIVFDADIGLANVEIELGFVPKYTIEDIIDQRKNILDILTDGPENLKFVSGGNGVERLINLTTEQLQFVIQNLSLLEYYADYIIIDTGAGINNIVYGFSYISDIVILVITPEPTSLADGYSLLKYMKSDVFVSKKLFLTINKVKKNTNHNQIAENFINTVNEYLNMKVDYLGPISYDDNVTKSIYEQSPIILRYPHSNASRCIRDITEILLNQKSKKGYGFKSLFQLLRGRGV